MIRTICTILFFLPFVCSSQITGKVTYVSDGDTFHLITSEGKKIKVRVADIDCPEKSQAYGLEAKAFVLGEIKHKQVELLVKDTDRYGRKIAFVKYDGKDLSEQLLKNGYAWHYKKYSNLASLAVLELFARSAKLGLWKESNVLAPWEYRKLKSN